MLSQTHFAKLVAAALVLMATAPAWGQDSAYAALATATREAVEREFAGSSDRIEIELPAPDPRLQFPLCAAPLETSIGRHNGQGGRLNVRVDCRDATPWARNMAPQVRVYREVVVAARNLSRGALVSAADISVQEVDISQVRGQLIADEALALGMEVRRNINAGIPFSSELLNAPLMVKRGDTVMLSADRAGISIRQQGTALQDGGAGQQISVRNTRSNRVVQAVVTAHGEARVMF